MECRPWRVRPTMIRSERNRRPREVPSPAISAASGRPPAGPARNGGASGREAQSPAGPGVWREWAFHAAHLPGGDRFRVSDIGSTRGEDGGHRCRPPFIGSRVVIVISGRQSSSTCTMADVHARQPRAARRQREEADVLRYYALELVLPLGPILAQSGDRGAPYGAACGIEQATCRPISSWPSWPNPNNGRIGKRSCAPAPLRLCLATCRDLRAAGRRPLDSPPAAST